jgi:hypothetical protein
LQRGTLCTGKQIGIFRAEKMLGVAFGKRLPPY